MSTTDVNTASESTSELSNLDLKLEAVVIPVADVDRIRHPGGLGRAGRARV